MIQGTKLTLFRWIGSVLWRKSTHIQLMYTKISGININQGSLVGHQSCGTLSFRIINFLVDS